MGTGSKARTIPLVTALVALSPAVLAQVKVSTGQPIPGGRGRAPADIQLENEHLAVTFSVKTPPPFGLPAGALVDGSEIVAGKRVKDRFRLLDFLPNGWSAWKYSYARVTVLQRGPEEGVIRVERDWDGLTVDTLVTLRRGQTALHLVTTLSNPTDRTFRGLRSGYTLWSEGTVFGVPGLSGKSGPAAGRLADFTAVYGPDWVAGLHASFFDRFEDEGNSLQLEHSLGPGQSRSFEAWFELLPGPDLARLLAGGIRRKNAPAGRVTGTVRTVSGAPVAKAYVVVLRGGAPLTFSVPVSGRYAIDLPAGEYRLYATAEAMGPSSERSLTAVAGETVQLDLDDMRAGATLKLTIADQNGPVDARLTLVDERPPVPRTLGRATFFTELERKGHAVIALAPGRHTLEVSSGAPFLSLPVRLTVTLESGQQKNMTLAVQREPMPFAGWRCADLHHHSNLSDAATPPQVLVQSQLAAGLDYLLVSDHDQTDNHAAIAALAAKRSVPFIPSIEISPSWGHFNVFPVRLGATLGVEPATTDPSGIFAAARAMGATVIQANHPLWGLGYLFNADAGRVPGDFDPGFDLLELNFSAGFAETVPRAHAYWNQGKRYYLGSGSDVHDAWGEVSGCIRTCARLAGDTDAAAFALAVKAGKAYVTLGPLLDARPVPGDTLRAKAGTAVELRFDLYAAEGLRAAHLVRDGKVDESRAFGGAHRAQVVFASRVDRGGWCALQAEDAAGNLLWTNPIWLEVEDRP